MTSEGASFDSIWGVEGVRRGGRGRKLQLLLGRAETRVKISAIRRCCTAVSFGGERQLVCDRWWWWWWGLLSLAYQLGVEFGQAGLAIVVED